MIVRLEKWRNNFDFSHWKDDKSKPVNAQRILEGRRVCFRRPTIQSTTGYCRQLRADQTTRFAPCPVVWVKSNEPSIWAEWPVGSLSARAASTWSSDQSWPAGIQGTCPKGWATRGRVIWWPPPAVYLLCPQPNKVTTTLQSNDNSNSNDLRESGTRG